MHAAGEAQRFYEQLAAPALVGMEATGNSQWFIEMVEDLGHEIWIGDAAQLPGLLASGISPHPET